MKKLVLVILMSICLMSGGFSMHRIEGANATIDSQGNRVYTEGPPPTTITAGWLNAVQEEIATVITNAGLPLKTEATETGDQLWQALTVLGRPYDYIVNSNTTFAEVLERVGANQYRFKNEYKSLFFSQITSGYSMPLSAGDTWGYIQTNACVNLRFESDAYINMGNERGYIEVNTDNCLLDSVSVRGLGTVASAITRSFLLNANYVTFQNCDSRNRLSNAAMVVFEGSGTTLHNQTSQVNYCRVINITSSNNVYGFQYFWNTNGCFLYDVESTLANVRCFTDVKNATNCKMIKIDAGSSMYGFISSDNISNAYMEDFDAPAGNAQAISICNNVSNITITDFEGRNSQLVINTNIITNINISNITATGGVVIGIRGNNISNCRIETMDATGNCHAYYQCSQLTNCYAEDIDSSGGDAAGFYDCDNISSSCSDDIDSAVGTYYGFQDCTQVVGCDAQNCEDGFNTCYRVAGCRATSNDNNGYMACSYMSACIALSNGNDGFEDCSIISACASNSNTGNGFDNCKNMTANRASGNTAANYLNSFADWASLNACADTAAGGYNS